MTRQSMFQWGLAVAALAVVILALVILRTRERPLVGDAAAQLRATISSQQATITALAPTPTAPTATPSLTPLPSATLGPSATPVPPPTPTPITPILKETKFGIGVYSTGGGHVLDALRRAQPTILLLQDPDPTFAREVRRWFPKAFIIGRRFVQPQPLDNPGPQGEAMADYVAQLAVPLKDVVNAWMSYNEVIEGGNIPQYQAWNTFQVAFARKLHGAYGVPAVAGNDFPGVVAPEDYPRYFADALRESQYFGIHAYAPAGARSLRDQADWYVLRYRKIHLALAAAGVSHGPIVLTETGFGDGWRDRMDEDQLAQELAWLTNEMNKDPYVLGQAFFGLFADGNWQNFDIYGKTILLDRLGAYQPAGG